MRAGLIKVSEQVHILMVDVHHIIADGISLEVLIKDFMMLYHDDQLPVLTLQYRDYSEWQQGEQYRSDLSRQKSFWQSAFSEGVSFLQLPFDFPRPSVKGHAGSRVNFRLTREVTSQLKMLAEDEESTLFMVLLSIYTIFLSKISNQEEIVVGTPTSGRTHADLQNIVGMFVNTLPVGVCAMGEYSFRHFLRTVRKTTVDCFDHQGYPYEDLIELLQIERDTSRNPLFDVMFVFQNFEQSALSLPGLSLKPYAYEHTVAKFDLTLTAVEIEEELSLGLEYSTALFKRETIERFVHYLTSITEEVIRDREKAIKAIDVLSEGEKDLLLKGFNDTACEYPKDESILSSFDRWVERDGARTALIWEGTRMSYRSLKDQASRIAWYLREEKGVQHGDLVGIMLEREGHLLPFIFGILSSGAAYVPIDPHYPKARRKTIIQDSGLKLLITLPRCICANR